MRRFLLLALAVFLFDASFLQEDETSNARVRLALTRAIVEEGRLAIDSFQAQTNDKAFYGGHYYCDKAPLLSMLAVPPYWILHRLGVSDEHRLLYGLRLSIVSLATAVALPLFGLLLRRAGCASSAALATSAAGWFGTALLPYGTVFFGHNVTFLLIVAALVALPAHAVLCGACLGLSVSSDYQALPLALLVGLYGSWRGGRRACAWMLCGAAPPLVLLGAYHAALFGNPFTLPVKYEVYAQVHNMDVEYTEGFYGLVFPRAGALGLLLLSPGKGLLALSPFLLVMPMAGVRGRDRLPALCFIALLGYVPFIAMAPSHHGGFSFGPRLLLPVLPFALLLAGIALSRAPRLLVPFAIGAAFSAFAYVCATATVIAVPYDFRNPLGELMLPAILRGQPTWNAGRLLGLPGSWSLVPVLLVVGGLVMRALWGVDRAERGAATPSAARL